MADTASGSLSPPQILSSATSQNEKADEESYHADDNAQNSQNFFNFTRFLIIFKPNLRKSSAIARIRCKMALITINAPHRRYKYHYNRYLGSWILVTFFFMRIIPTQQSKPVSATVGRTWFPGKGKLPRTYERVVHICIVCCCARYCFICRPLFATGLHKSNKMCNDHKLQLI